MANGAPGGRKQLNKNQLFKRQKVRDARTIRAEAVRFDTKHTTGSGSRDTDSGHSLSESGGLLNVGAFVSSRQFETKELQFAMQNSKSASSTRVFQSLPRSLRRRTASHNVKRIPKRMRNRALREMAKNDQKTAIASVGRKSTIFKKLKANHGLSAAALYKAKMSVKLLRLASKSASMKLAIPRDVLSRNKNIRSKIRLLNSQIKENRKNPAGTQRNNVMGSYDSCAMNKLASVPVGRIKFFKRQRFFTWLPSHIWNAKRSHMIKRWGYQIPWSPTQKCFKMTHRLGSNVASSDGALAMDTSFYGTMILTDMLQEDGTGANLKAIVAKIAGDRSLLKKYRESRNWFEGYAYDIDNESSIIMGPIDLLWIDSHNVLIRLHPSIYITIFQSLIAKYGETILLQDCRFSIGSITIKGAKSLTALSSILRTQKDSTSFAQLQLSSKIADTSVLPQKTMFAFECIDPRHLAAPKQVKQGCSTIPTIDDIINMQRDFPSDEISDVLRKLTNAKEREKSYSNQQTLKQLAARRQKLMESGPNVQFKNMIPYNTKTDPLVPLLIIKRQINDDWVVLLPWFWVLPFWYQLNRVSRVYHMGLRQFQQLSYESHRLYFPDDYPFTAVGHTENSQFKRDTKKSKWGKKASGKRLEFTKLSGIHKNSIPSFEGEIGDYFSCDWKLLQILRNGLKFLTKDGNVLKLCEENRTTQFDSTGLRAIQVLNDLFELYKDLTTNDRQDIHPDASLPIELVTGKITELKKITWEQPVQALICETPLPVKAISCTCVGRGHPKDNARIYQIPPEDTDYWRTISAGLYRSNGKKDNETKALLPSISDLVGFITSGGYHLGEGKGSAQGFIDAEVASKLSNKHLLIRNVGTNTYRLVEWSYIPM